MLGFTLEFFFVCNRKTFFYYHLYWVYCNCELLPKFFPLSLIYHYQKTAFLAKWSSKSPSKPCWLWSTSPPWYFYFFSVIKLYRQAWLPYQPRVRADFLNLELFDWSTLVKFTQVYFTVLVGKRKPLIQKKNCLYGTAWTKWLLDEQCFQ